MDPKWVESGNLSSIAEGKQEYGSEKIGWVYQDFKLDKHCLKEWILIHIIKCVDLLARVDSVPETVSDF